MTKKDKFEKIQIQRFSEKKKTLKFRQPQNFLKKKSLINNIVIILKRARLFKIISKKSLMSIMIRNKKINFLDNYDKLRSKNNLSRVNSRIYNKFKYQIWRIMDKIDVQNRNMDIYVKNTRQNENNTATTRYDPFSERKLTTKITKPYDNKKYTLVELNNNIFINKKKNKDYSRFGVLKYIMFKSIQITSKIFFRDTLNLYYELNLYLNDYIWLIEEIDNKKDQSNSSYFNKLRLKIDFLIIILKAVKANKHFTRYSSFSLNLLFIYLLKLFDFILNCKLSKINILKIGIRRLIPLKRQYSWKTGEHSPYNIYDVSYPVKKATFILGLVLFNISINNHYFFWFVTGGTYFFISDARIGFVVFFLIFFKLYLITTKDTYLGKKINYHKEIEVHKRSKMNYSVDIQEKFKITERLINLNDENAKETLQIHIDYWLPLLYEKFRLIDNSTIEDRIFYLEKNPELLVNIPDLFFIYYFKTMFDKSKKELIFEIYQLNVIKICIEQAKKKHLLLYERDESSDDDDDDEDEDEDEDDEYDDDDEDEIEIPLMEVRNFEYESQLFENSWIINVIYDRIQAEIMVQNFEKSLDKVFNERVTDYFKKKLNKLKKKILKLDKYSLSKRIKFKTKISKLIINYYVKCLKVLIHDYVFKSDILNNCDYFYKLFDFILKVNLNLISSYYSDTIITYNNSIKIYYKILKKFNQKKVKKYYLILINHLFPPLTYYHFLLKTRFLNKLESHNNFIFYLQENFEKILNLKCSWTKKELNKCNLFFFDKYPYSLLSFRYHDYLKKKKNKSNIFDIKNFTEYENKKSNEPKKNIIIKNDLNIIKSSISYFRFYSNKKTKYNELGCILTKTRQQKSYFLQKEEKEYKQASQKISFFTELKKVINKKVSILDVILFFAACCCIFFYWCVLDNIVDCYRFKLNWSDTVFYKYEAYKLDNYFYFNKLIMFIKILIDALIFIAIYKYYFKDNIILTYLRKILNDYNIKVTVNILVLIFWINYIFFLIEYLAIINETSFLIHFLEFYYCFKLFLIDNIEFYEKQNISMHMLVLLILNIIIFTLESINYFANIFFTIIVNLNLIVDRIIEFDYNSNRPTYYFSSEHANNFVILLEPFMVLWENLRFISNLMKISPEIISHTVFPDFITENRLKFYNNAKSDINSLVKSNFDFNWLFNYLSLLKKKETMVTMSFDNLNLLINNLIEKKKLTTLELPNNDLNRFEKLTNDIIKNLSDLNEESNINYYYTHDKRFFYFDNLMNEKLLLMEIRKDYDSLSCNEYLKFFSNELCETMPNCNQKMINCLNDFITTFLSEIINPALIVLINKGELVNMEYVSKDYIDKFPVNILSKVNYETILEINNSGVLKQNLENFFSHKKSDTMNQIHSDFDSFRWVNDIFYLQKISLEEFALEYGIKNDMSRFFMFSDYELIEFSKKKELLFNKFDTKLKIGIDEIIDTHNKFKSNYYFINHNEFNAKKFIKDFDYFINETINTNNIYFNNMFINNIHNVNPLKLSWEFLNKLDIDVYAKAFDNLFNFASQKWTMFQDFNSIFQVINLEYANLSNSFLDSCMKNNIEINLLYLLKLKHLENSFGYIVIYLLNWIFFFAVVMFNLSYWLIEMIRHYYYYFLYFYRLLMKLVYKYILYHNKRDYDDDEFD